MRNKLKFEKENKEFVEEVAGLSVPDLDARLATLAKGLYETQEAKENDEELMKARDAVRELTAPYNDARKIILLKSAYIAALVEEKGGK